MTDRDSLESLVRAFEACTLPAHAWTHAAHLKVALYYVHKLGREHATAVLRAGLQRYNASIRERSLRYHETITLAWIAIIAELVAEQPGRTLPELADELVARFDDPHLLERYYSRELLFSPAARESFVAPDKRPFGAAAPPTPVVSDGVL